MPGQDYAGSTRLTDINTTELTDAATTCVFVIDNVEDVQCLLINVTTDKGCTVDVERYLDATMQIVGKPATQGTIANGGPSDSFKYPDLGCQACKVTITKTEAGTTSGFAAVIRGQAG